MYRQISTLTQLDSEEVSIKGQIQRIIRFNTQKGMAMSIIIKGLDKSEIQCIFWSQQYQRFKNIIKELQSFEFKRFKIQRIRYPRYNKTKHEFEIVICPQSIIKQIKRSILVKKEGADIECIEIKQKCNNKTKRNKKSKNRTIKQPMITNYFC